MRNFWIIKIKYIHFLYILNSDKHIKSLAVRNKALSETITKGYSSKIKMIEVIVKLKYQQRENKLRNLLLTLSIESLKCLKIWTENFKWYQCGMLRDRSKSKEVDRNSTLMLSAWKGVHIYW